MRLALPLFAACLAYTLAGAAEPATLDGAGRSLRTLLDELDDSKLLMERYQARCQKDRNRFAWCDVIDDRLGQINERILQIRARLEELRPR
jgi:hypothetical protein